MLAAFAPVLADGAAFADRRVLFDFPNKIRSAAYRMRAAQADVAALVGNGGAAACLAAETGLRGFDAAFDAAVKLYVGMCGECGGGKCGSEEKFQVHGLSFFWRGIVRRLYRPCA